MDERILIQKSLAGDEKAFAELVGRNKERILRHCQSIVHDQEIAEDLTQEAFLHAFQHLSSFRKEASFSTWIWRISHNLALNYLKKHRHVEQEYKEELLIPRFLSQEEVDEEKMDLIYEAMATLSPKLRAVFEMYDLQHMPQKEIAAELGIPHGTVRSRTHYARERIRKFLRDR